MYRLKLFSRRFGVDESGPLHPTLEQAQRAAQILLQAYHGDLKVEIRRVLDMQLRRSELVQTMVAKANEK